MEIFWCVQLSADFKGCDFFVMMHLISLLASTML